MLYIIGVIIVLMIVKAIILLPEFIVVSWNNTILEIDSTWLIVFLLVIFLISHIFLIMLYRLLKAKNANRHKQAEQNKIKAQKELTLGLLTMIEGNYLKAKKYLLTTIEYSPTPELNYIALANIAQHQQTYDQRDIFLGKANALNINHHSAIAIAQATMQIQSNQCEIARATLENLLSHNHNHPMGIQLLAHVYYQQHDWFSLLKLTHQFDKSATLPFIPNIIFQPKKPTHQTGKTVESLKIAAFKGLLNQPSITKDKIDHIWKHLPPIIQKKPEAIYHYCQALILIGKPQQAQKRIIESLTHHWSNQLIELYGKLPNEHVKINIQKALPLLNKNKRNPHLLLCLARLYKKDKQWQQSANYYVDSINLIPNSLAYLELAELMDQLTSKHNAFICYRQGLRYSVYQTGELLQLETLFSH